MKTTKIDPTTKVKDAAEENPAKIDRENGAETNEELDFDPNKMRRLPRGAFLAKPGVTTDPQKTKVRVTLYLDSDILTYFKQRAEGVNAAPYQTQINNELRSVMENNQFATDYWQTDYWQLVQNKQFIAAVAEKVAAYTMLENTMLENTMLENTMLENTMLENTTTEKESGK